MSVAGLQPGSEVAGHRIDAVAGRGGMGVVYRATHLALQRTVALKVVAPGLADDEDFRRRFAREARLAASLEHPNVLPIYETGDAGGLLWVTMRFVDGIDLRERLAGEGRLAPPEAARVVGDVASALDAAHASGLVHRDVKPANVLLARDGHVYLTDFGLTKRPGEGDLTATGQFVGTVSYVAPEQIRGGAVDARADVYALGCVLFEALTGVVPFPRDSEVAAMFAHLNDPHPPPTSIVPGLSPAWDAVIARALAKDPAHRFPSAGDLGRAARAAAEHRPFAEPERSVARGEAAPAAAVTAVEAAPVPGATAVPPPVPPTHVLPARPPVATPPTAPGAPAARRRTGAWVAGLAALLLLGGGAAALALGLAGGEGEGTTRAGGGTQTAERSGRTTGGEDGSRSRDPGTGGTRTDTGDDIRLQPGGGTPDPGGSGDGGATVAEADVQTVLDRYADAYGGEDLDALSGLLTSDVSRRNGTEELAGRDPVLGEYARQFDEIAIGDYDLTNRGVAPGAGEGTATATYVITDDGGAQIGTGTIAFHLREEDGALLIDRLDIDPA